MVADISQTDDCRRLVDTTIAAFKRLDVLVNNAGRGMRCPITDAAVTRKYDEVMATNVRSVVYLTHLCVEHLEKTKGSVVNISSIAGLRPFPGASLYCMSKCAIDMLTKCLALELGPKGIRVNAINPGAIRTNFLTAEGMTAKQRDERYAEMGHKYPIGRVGDPIDIVRPILFLASDESAFVTGINFAADGGALHAAI